MDLHPDMKKRLEQEDWGYFAHMAHSFELELEEDAGESAKLHKELQMVRKVLHAHLSTEKGREKFVSTKFMIQLHKTIAKLEAKLAEHGHMHGEFLNFLRALMHKMKQEKLVVYKTLEKTREFERHKEDST